jgi:HAD superfamily hydrolase (TIGR01509 family)
VTAIKALFFDQDGVIVDSERDGHRVAFNQTFREFGFDVNWDVDTYQQLLKIAGGKERARHYLHTVGFGKSVASEDEDDLIRSLHKRKTELFVELIQEGKLPLRPGVYRLMREAMDEGLVLGICTTSNERAANALVKSMLADIRFDFVLAGDIVPEKKPAPDIYFLALDEAHLDPENCVVIEDSSNGVLAAKSAALKVIATTSAYTVDEDLSGADVVLSCLGDPDGEKGCLISSRRTLEFEGVLGIGQIMDHFKEP